MSYMNMYGVEVRNPNRLFMIEKAPLSNLKCHSVKVYNKWWWVFWLGALGIVALYLAELILIPLGVIMLIVNYFPDLSQFNEFLIGIVAAELIILAWLVTSSLWFFLPSGRLYHINIEYYDESAKKGSEAAAVFVS